VAAPAAALRLRRGPCCARGGSKQGRGAGGGGLEGALYRSEGEGEKATEAVGGALRQRPLMAVVRGGGVVPVGLQRREGTEEVRLGSVKLRAMLVRPEDRRS
jgi:hypothetical protein